jgi:HEAT repeat protein
MFRSLLVNWNIRTLDKRPNKRKCIAAIHRLGRIDDKRAIARLMEMIDSMDFKTDQTVLHAIKWSLCSGKNPKVVEPLLELMEKGRWLGKRRFIADILGGLNDKRAVEPLIRELPIGNLEAICALSLLMDNRAIEPLARIFYADELYALTEVTVFGTKCIKKMEDRERHLFKSEAMKALIKFQDEKTIEPLLITLCDVDCNTRIAAASALDELGQPKWKTIINGNGDDFLQLEQSGVRCIIEKLVRLYTSQLNAALVKTDPWGDMFSVPDYQTRDNAMEGLKRIQALSLD